MTKWQKDVAKMYSPTVHKNKKTSKEAFYRGCIHLTVFIILNIKVVILVIMEGAYTFANFINYDHIVVILVIVEGAYTLKCVSSYIQAYYSAFPL